MSGRLGVCRLLTVNRGVSRPSTLLEPRVRDEVQGSCPGVFNIRARLYTDGWGPGRLRDVFWQDMEVLRVWGVLNLRK